MKCSQCKKTNNLPIHICPFCSTPHEAVRAIFDNWGESILGSEQFIGLIWDLMPKVESKYLRMFKQALSEGLDERLFNLSKEHNRAIASLDIASLKAGFKDNNGYNIISDYVLDCFLYAYGWLGIKEIKDSQVAYKQEQNKKIEDFTVTENQYVEILYFFADNTTIANKKESVINLFWKTQNAKEVKISQIDQKLPPNGSCTISISRDTSIELIAYDPFGKSVSHVISITVNKTPPSIKNFESSHEFIFKQQDILLKWEVDGAEKVELEDIADSLPPLGELVSRIPSDTEIKLKATSFFGMETTQSIYVKGIPQPVIETLNIESPLMDINIDFSMPELKVEREIIVPEFSIKPIDINVPIISNDITELDIPEDIEFPLESETSILKIIQNKVMSLIKP